ncbi:MAG: hypothetical protein RL220_1389 [Bacteroidota bacterium]
MKYTILFFLVLIIMTGCGNSRPAAAWNVYPESGSEYAQMDMGGMDLLQEGEFDNEPRTQERMIVTSAALELAVEFPDTMPEAMNRIAARFNGYVSQGGTDMAVIRVPEDKLDPAIEAISQLGKVRSRSQFGYDVSDQYRDSEIRLENALKARERYLELLARAENVEAAVMVERELERLNETIELMKGQMNQLEHLSQYATITVSIHERKKPGILGYVGLGLYHSVKWLFVRN